jgi:hypothetical protein
MERAADRLRAAVARVDDPVAQVEVWIQSIIGAAADPRRVARARLFSSLPTVMRRYSQVVEEGKHLLQAPLHAAIVAGRDAGVFPWSDPDRDAVVVYELAGSALSSSLADDPEQPLDEVVASTVAFVLRALGMAPGSATDSRDS